MTRALIVLAWVSTVVLGYLGLRQGMSLVLREEEPRVYWPRSEGGSHVGSFIDGRGHVTYTGRSEWSAFRGGGPGHGK